MRLVFMGTPAFALPSLVKLAQSKHEISAVVTQPDRMRGRGQKVCLTAVKEQALALGLPVLQPQKVREPDFGRQLADLQPELIIVVAFGQILPPEILRLPRYGCLNVHASLLPRYRGAAPLQRAVMAGETKTGVTIMLMNEGLDTGDILRQAEVVLPLTFTGGELHDCLAEKGAALLAATLPLWQAGEIVPRPQKEAMASYAPPLTKEDERIIWSQTAVVLYNQIRALNPYPGAFTLWQGKPLKIRESAIYTGARERDGRPGEVVQLVKGQGFVVQTGEGCLLLKQVQPAGKKIMSAASFGHGYHLSVGDVCD